MVEAFERLGRASNIGMGRVPLMFSEIVADAPWADHRERALLREMSAEYLAGWRIGEDPFGIPPWKG